MRRGDASSPESLLGSAVRHKVDKPPPLQCKVAYDGRLNARKALAAIGSLVD